MRSVRRTRTLTSRDERMGSQSPPPFPLVKSSGSRKGWFSLSFLLRSAWPLLFTSSLAFSSRIMPRNLP